MGRRKRKKTASQLFTFSQIVRNNKQIFSKEYPKMPGENEHHYICKSYLGNMIKKYLDCDDVDFEYKGLPVLSTANGDRKYQPDIWASFINHKKKEIYLSCIEIAGGIHFKNKVQYLKNKLRRETIVDYFARDYKNYEYPKYQVFFSYCTFQPDDFLYNKIDFFLDIIQEKFINGGIYPPRDLYEEIFL
jgi:hypothetical protein